MSSRDRRMSLGMMRQPEPVPAPAHHRQGVAANGGQTQNMPNAAAAASMRLRRMSLPARAHALDALPGPSSRQTTPRKPLHPWLPPAVTPRKAIDAGGSGPLQSTPRAQQCGRGASAFGRAPPPFKAGKVRTNTVGEPALLDMAAAPRPSTGGKHGVLERSSSMAGGDLPVAALREPAPFQRPHTSAFCHSVCTWLQRNVGPLRTLGLQPFAP